MAHSEIKNRHASARIANARAIARSAITTPPLDRDTAIRVFAQKILHGSDEHRAWLEQAAECFLNGEPLPAPVG